MRLNLGQNNVFISKLLLSLKAILVKQNQNREKAIITFKPVLKSVPRVTDWVLLVSSQLSQVDTPHNSVNFS